MFTATTLRRALLPAALAAAAFTSVGVLAGPASAASSQNCANNPSNANCDNVAVSKGDPCWNSAYAVAPTGGGTFYYDDNGWQFKTQLMYSTICKSNFAYTVMTKGGNSAWYEVSDKIRRSAGTDGGYLMYHAGFTTMYPWSSGSEVISPMVYSPNDTAQACVSTRANDQAACSSWL